MQGARPRQASIASNTGVLSLVTCHDNGKRLNLAPVLFLRRSRDRDMVPGGRLEVDKKSSYIS